MDEEVGKFKWLMGAILVFLVSGYYSYGEMKFAIWGKTTEAQITKFTEKMSVGRRSKPMVIIEYQFAEDGGTTRNERDSVSADSAPPLTGSIEVQYLPGVPGSSRIAANAHFVAVYVFIACIVFLAFSIYQLSREANETGAQARQRLRR